MKVRAFNLTLNLEEERKWCLTIKNLYVAQDLKY